MRPETLTISEAPRDHGDRLGAPPQETFRAVPRIDDVTARACPFASKTVTEHLLRGVGAAALIVLALRLAQLTGGWPVAGALAAGTGAVALMRGCPTCWLTGLFATLAARSRRTTPEAGQAVRECAASPSSASPAPTAVPSPR